MLMLGSKYFEVEDTHSQKFMSSTHPFLCNMNQNQGFLSSCDIYPNHLPTILKQNFRPLPYMPDLLSINPFCPLCLKFIHPNSSSLGCFVPVFGKTYLAHEECLQREQSNCLSTIVEEINHARLGMINSINDARSFCFGEKQFYVQMQISHPLTSKPYFTLKNKIQTNGSFLVWNFGKFHESSFCFPNIIAFPYPDFDVEIGFSELSQRNGMCRHKVFVNLQRMAFESDKLVKISTDEFDLIIRVVIDQRRKLQIIDEMNFKYQHPLDINLPLIELIKLQLKLPNNDSDQENQYVCNKENSSITQLLNQSSPETSTIKSISYTQKERNAYLSEMISEKSQIKQKIDLYKLISSGNLSQYVKNNTQSRHFQAYLSQANSDELNDILKTLTPNFCELVTHEYANYMMQKLFTLCVSSQRMYILQKLASSIPMIVKNKQGTHTLQAMIALLTQEEEFILMTQSVKNSLFELSDHSNATHFIQKIINIFPLKYTLSFYEFACDNFLRFSLSKSAMCVLKQMMKKLKAIEEEGFKNMSKIQNEEIKRKFINSTVHNIDRIIQDCYGNYVVQFCYEFFGYESCIRVTEMIVDRFSQYSIQKYSGSVVFKCVDIYWENKEIVQRLHSSLNANSIMDLYRNKQGNKILLTIMEKFENTAIRQKIYNQLVMAEPAKFQHDRWGITLGSRSGTAGTSWSSFTDAVKPSPIKKKKHYNIIQ